MDVDRDGSPGIRPYPAGAAPIPQGAGARYAEASLPDLQSFVVAGILIPVMIASTLAGRRISRGLGERGYAVLF